MSGYNIFFAELIPYPLSACSGMIHLAIEIFCFNVLVILIGIQDSNCRLQIGLEFVTVLAEIVQQSCDFTALPEPNLAGKLC
ncbi:MAG: hypothetical protein AAF497_14755 [Planctomycetota bacterium]